MQSEKRWPRQSHSWDICSNKYLNFPESESSPKSDNSPNRFAGWRPVRTSWSWWWWYRRWWWWQWCFDERLWYSPACFITLEIPTVTQLGPTYLPHDDDDDDDDDDCDDDDYQDCDYDDDDKWFQVSEGMQTVWYFHLGKSENRVEACFLCENCKMRQFWQRIFATSNCQMPQKTSTMVCNHSIGGPIVDNHRNHWLADPKTIEPNWYPQWCFWEPLKFFNGSKMWS